MAAGLVIDWLGVSWAWIARLLRQGLIRKERGWMCLAMRVVVDGREMAVGFRGGCARREGGAVVVVVVVGLRTTTGQRLAWPLAGAGRAKRPPSAES